MIEGHEDEEGCLCHHKRLTLNESSDVSKKNPFIAWKIFFQTHSTSHFSFLTCFSHRDDKFNLVFPTTILSQYE